MASAVTEAGSEVTPIIAAPYQGAVPEQTIGRRRESEGTIAASLENSLAGEKEICEHADACV